MTKAAPDAAATEVGACAGSPFDRPSRTARWAVVDVLRGIAIIAVVAFHLTWDLGDLGFISWRISAHWSGKVIAHAIAGSFLLLVGLSLVLAHRRGIRWASFWRREVQLVALALVITGFSAIFEPGELVTFGILHAIALVSLVGLPVVQAPRIVPWALAVVALVLPWIVHLPGRSPWVSWTGLADGTEPSLDWQPMLPWIALTFGGVGLMRWLLDTGEEATTVARLRAWRPTATPVRWVGVLGRHTLAIYVVHQPVLYGALWLLAQPHP
ncbi:hypothetical protein GCM10011492_24490 [Flexivirga endophytica]|uniref:Heparan-alpha-glucosaminide N-acetyltransferase catalytic domain-containing protein n=1 Tax=Flexivirga endophytica TaxID=1849103 RepID=A0A916WVC8_9MICO|nr:heparan-alpha-glucosaminide N-acetyltransferase [Flexivirga endophytica]GGB33011.1 hypothetical protein GCM10011492_24490 [Flexivirga endophytica]GHB40998.1 hypothetical protein GCM10008112_06880 [Flexivirga endophytica]